MSLDTGWTEPGWPAAATSLAKIPCLFFSCPSLLFSFPVFSSFSRKLTIQLDLVRRPVYDVASSKGEEGVIRVGGPIWASIKPGPSLLDESVKAATNLHSDWTGF